MRRTLALTLSLVACSQQTQDTDFTRGLVVEDVSVPSCDTTDTTIPTESLTASTLTPGFIQVQHRGYRAHCCLILEVRAVALTGDATIRVDYLDSADTCDCTCSYDLDYTLTLVPSGTWEIQPPGISTSATTQ